MNPDPYPVARLADFPPGSHRIVTVNDVAIGVFHLENGAGFRAYVDFCPHAGAAFCDRPLVPGPDGRPALRCPWHGWEFDLDTGTHLLNPRCRLNAVKVMVNDEGTVVVETANGR